MKEVRQRFHYYKEEEKVEYNKFDDEVCFSIDNYDDSYTDVYLWENADDEYSITDDKDVPNLKPSVDPIPFTQTKVYAKLASLLRISPIETLYKLNRRRDLILNVNNDNEFDTERKNDTVISKEKKIIVTTMNDDKNEDHDMNPNFRDKIFTEEQDIPLSLHLDRENNSKGHKLKPCILPLEQPPCCDRSHNNSEENLIK